MREAIEGWLFVIGSIDCVVVASLALFSELYITATLVDGEFIVPVSDHPIAT